MSSARRLPSRGRHDGEIVGALGIGRDITQRKQIERKLEEYRQRLEGLVAEESTKFRALVEQSLVGIYIIQDDVFRYANPGLIKMFGYDSADEVVDLIPVYRFIKEADRSLVEDNIRRRIRGEADATRYSFTAYKRDGTPIVVDAHGRRIEYQGRPAIIGTLIDITEMRRSKEELHRLVEEKSSRLQQSEELLRTLIEAIPDAIEFKDGEGRWLEVPEVQDWNGSPCWRLVARAESNSMNQPSTSVENIASTTGS